MAIDLRVHMNKLTRVLFPSAPDVDRVRLRGRRVPGESDGDELHPPAVLRVIPAAILSPTAS